MRPYALQPGSPDIGWRACDRTPYKSQPWHEEIAAVSGACFRGDTHPALCGWLGMGPCCIRWLRRLASAWHSVTADDDLPGGWSNPDGTERLQWLTALFWGQLSMGLGV